ncbi:MAG: hotdog fold thioesterase [Acidimicrobiia bacterium]|nr:hotdog fold thioesterase [Acidimicrobiia bacterium]
MSDVYRVSAYNTATESENRIHDDGVAKDFGFRGGLVPGVDVYAYMTHPPAELWGLEWLERGTMQARFVKPVYDGEWVTVEMSDTSETDAGTTVELTVHDATGDLCATGSAGLPSEPPSPVDVARYPTAPLPDRPPPASAAALLAADPLGSLEGGFHSEHAPSYLDDVRETLGIYLDAGVAHPGWLLRTANYILATNVVLGPWIHVESSVRHLGLVRDGDRISTRGRPSAVFERKGHRLVSLDLLVVANDANPVMHIDHTAIYEPRRGGR